MGAACLCACRQVVQLHRGWMAQTKASPVPFCESASAARMLHVSQPQIEANGSIRDKTGHKNKQVGFTRL